MNSSFVRFGITSIAALLISGVTWAEEKSVSTSGQCFRKTEADRGSVYLGVQLIEKDASQASKKASQIYEKVREYVKKQNLKDLELSTTALSVQREEAWESSTISGGRTVFKGYRATTGLELETSEISKLGEMVAKATELGANSIGNLRVFLSRSKQVEEERTCLESAVKDAKAKAGSMAQALGQKVGRAIKIIEDNSARPPRPAAYEMAAQAAPLMKSSADMASVVETKPIEVSVDVQVIFELN